MNADFVKVIHYYEYIIDSSFQFLNETWRQKLLWFHTVQNFKSYIYYLKNNKNICFKIFPFYP